MRTATRGRTSEWIHEYIEICCRGFDRYSTSPKGRFERFAVKRRTGQKEIKTEGMWEQRAAKWSG